MDPNKFFSSEEANVLIETVKREATRAMSLNHKVAVRDYFAIDLVLSTGLRVMEISKLDCGDIFLTDVASLLIVRKGKGGKRRQVIFSSAFKEHCIQYLSWKQSIGESTEPGQPLILSSNTGKHMTTRAIQKIFKRWAQKAGLSPRYSIHSARHSYACFLLKASKWNIRLVQKQLGHSKIETTQVYADVMLPDTKNAIERMYS